MTAYTLFTSYRRVACAILRCIARFDVSATRRAYCDASVMSIGPLRSRASMKYHSGWFGAIGPIGSVSAWVTATTFMPASGVMKRLSCDDEEFAKASSVHADTVALYAPLASLATMTSGPGARPSLIGKGATRMRTPLAGRPSDAIFTWPLTVSETGVNPDGLGEAVGVAVAAAVGAGDGACDAVTAGDGEVATLLPGWHARATYRAAIAVNLWNRVFISRRIPREELCADDSCADSHSKYVVDDTLRAYSISPVIRLLKSRRAMGRRSARATLS